MEAYRKPVQDIVAELKTDLVKGLPISEVSARKKRFGDNVLQAGKKINPLKLFASQFNDVLIIILIIAAAISFGLSLIEDEGGPTESILIIAIVIAIAIVGFFNEYKAEKTVEALRKLVGHKAKVRRGGQVSEIDATDLVPGDVVLLEEGIKVPADIRLTQVKNLHVNEASLTGESVPVGKNIFPVNQTSALGDQKNMVFSGTIIASGTAEGVVVTTGQKTEMGRIAGLVNEVEEDSTPMQKKLDELGRKIGALVLIISVIVFVIIYLLDHELDGVSMAQKLVFSFTAAVALAVAAIPEGLAFVVRISLALGARRMAAKKALVRKLSAVEALGSTNVICSDKTGTLTRGEMTVRQIWSGGATYDLNGSGYEITGEFSRDGKAVESKLLAPVLKIGALCNNAQLREASILGDPTEGSLLVSAAKAGLEYEDLNRQYPRVDEIPFTSDRKLMSTVHSFRRGYLVATKGAVEVLLSNCTKVWYGGKVVQLSEEIKNEILSANASMSQSALRVLGVAFKETAVRPTGSTVESDLIFLGAQGMMDPPRTEVKEVITRVTTEAGMRVIMITGDYVDTARAVAAEIGITGDAISGTELDQMTQEQFEQRVENIAVYARVNPEHKIRIVQALKSHGHQVAMTGDGVNDAPAIKASDIGIAMGITGTDASKEASDMILLDDQFLTIINAVEEGRGIFDNVRKFVNYLLSCNIAEVVTVVAGVVFFGNLVLSAVQLLFINIVTDGLPAIALGSDPAEKGIMRFKPNRFQGAIINRRVWIEMVLFGLAMSAVILGYYWWIGGHDHEPARGASVVFTGMVLYQMVRLIAIRSEYKISWLSNPWLIVAILMSVVLQLAVVYLPWMNELFGIVPLLPNDWIFIGVGAVVLFIFTKLADIILDRIFKEKNATRPQPQATLA